MPPKDENSCPLIGADLRCEKDIHLRVSIIVSRNHIGDDGVAEQNQMRTYWFLHAAFSSYRVNMTTVESECESLNQYSLTKGNQDMKC